MRVATGEREESTSLDKEVPGGALGLEPSAELEEGSEVSSAENTTAPL